MQYIRRSFNCYSKLGALLINEALLQEKKAAGINRLAGLSDSRGCLVTVERACITMQQTLNGNYFGYVGPLWNMAGKELVAWRDKCGAVELMICQYGGDDGPTCCLTAKRLANVIKRWIVDDGSERCFSQMLTCERLNKDRTGFSISSVAPEIAPLGMPRAELLGFLKAGAQAIIDSILGKKLSRHSRETVDAFVGVPLNPIASAVKEAKLKAAHEFYMKEFAGQTCLLALSLSIRHAMRDLMKEWMLI